MFQLMEEDISKFNQTFKLFLILFGVFVFGVLIGLFLADIGYVSVGQQNFASIATSQENQEIRVDLAIDYGNGDLQAFPGELLRQGDTVLDLLENLERGEGIILEKRNFPGLGVFIEAIHGVHNTNQSYWQFWVNGEYAKVGAAQYVLKDGDEVLWKRTGEYPK